MQRGVNHLDATEGDGWEDSIDFTRFDMSNPCCCVIGMMVNRHPEVYPRRNAYSYFSKYLAAHKLEYISPPYMNPAVLYGFDRPDAPSIKDINSMPDGFYGYNENNSLGDYYNELQDEWKRVITERKKNRQATNLGA